MLRRLNFGQLIKYRTPNRTRIKTVHVAGYITKLKNPTKVSNLEMYFKLSVQLLNALYCLIRPFLAYI